MTDELAAILSLYAQADRVVQIQAMGAAGGFSGARFWQVSTGSGLLCLRRWPREHPSVEWLRFIHGVLMYGRERGFRLLPVPLTTRSGQSFVYQDGHLWELAAWMPGEADFREKPTKTRFQQAMVALAQFHQAVADFPMEEPREGVSPGLGTRQELLTEWMAGRLQATREHMAPSACPSLFDRAERVLRLVSEPMPRVLNALQASHAARVSIQPCIRDIWHAHILYQDDEVSGIVDFGAMAPENVAGDIARLLGSMAGDDRELWREGIDAYEQVRPLTDVEQRLIPLFDRSNVILSGLNWIDWIYCQGRVFDDLDAVAARLDEILSRLVELAGRDEDRADL